MEKLSWKTSRVGGFKVNGQRIKIYFGHDESANEVIEAYHLAEV